MALLQECYNSLGDLMDMLVLGNSASNFMVYCLMSTKFRKTLLKVDQLTILLLYWPVGTIRSLIYRFW